MNDCIFCSEKIIVTDDNTVVLRQKGCDSINASSQKRGDNISVSSGQIVHKSCRQKYINEKYIENHNKRKSIDEEICNSRCNLRSDAFTFTMKEHCLFCSSGDKFDGKKKMHELIPVRTKSDFFYSIIDVCQNRDDEWGLKVKDRINFVHDLPAADACYHQQCSVNFRTNKQIPQDFTTENLQNKKPRLGRPEDVTRLEAFLKVTEYLEDNDEEQITINDLVDEMANILDGTGCEPYSFHYMKKKILEHFSNRIIISEISGKQNVVTFRTTAEQILHNFYFTPKDKDSEIEKIRLIKTAAKLIKNDVKLIKPCNDSYASPEDLAPDKCIEYIPDLLRIFLETLFVGKDVNIKLAAIGQALMQSIRPRVLLPPLQIGVAVQMHHHFASRFLIDTLTSLGFCSSYKEVQKFERSAALVQGSDIPVVSSDQFSQFIADNVDHNVRTLDGKGTFHGMGIIATITPGKKIYQDVARREVSTEDIISSGRIDIQYFKQHSNNLESLTYSLLSDIVADDITRNMEIMWKVSLLFKIQRPAWSGLMQTVHKEGTYPGKSSIYFLPMIDLDPSDMTCVYSTLKYVCTLCKKHTILPVITFDQPLWWKATLIIESSPTDSDLRSIILRLGGLHIQMSFLGSIGSIMGGSGIQEVLELIYAANAVTHILSGKAIARALRGHFIVSSALSTILASQAFGISIPSTEITSMETLELLETDSETTKEVEQIVNEHGIIDKEDVEEASEIFQMLLSGTLSVEQASTEDVLLRIGEVLDKHKHSLSNHRTAKLWLQYLEMIDILKQFIKAERTGNWQLHLKSLKDMLPFFAVSGHNLYTKSVQLYLQKMEKLHTDHPEVYSKFVQGYHVVRRSDRYWAGLSTDLVIEQVLMRSVKTSGGLTRGKGLTEIQRLVWLLSMPICAEFNNAMQNLTCINYCTSEQHKETSNTRLQRDNKDTNDIISYLNQRNPFADDLSLRSIATGIIANDTVNADEAKVLGQGILKSMIGKTADSYTFKRKSQTITLASKSTIKIGKEEVPVDPQLLFQRLVTAGERIGELSEMFKYELCSFPPSMFENSNVLRPATKAALADVLWTQLGDTKESFTSPAGDVQYVLDGGSLLHKIVWPNGITYEAICEIYLNYVIAKYGSTAIIVFDGYTDGPSTKDVTHDRRSTSYSAEVKFDKSMPCKIKKADFLSNPVNKQNFINLLSVKLTQSGCVTHHSPADADTLIVLKALDSATTTTTVLVGEDTDLLVLLLYHASANSFDVFFQPEQKKNCKKTKLWNITRAKVALGPNICNSILFLHAMTGCDTTSRLYGIGKGMAVKKIPHDKCYEQVQVFMNNSTKEEVITAGEQVMVSLYNGKDEECLDAVRYRLFCEKVSKSTCYVQPHTLPATSAAARYHSLRVYHQCQQWIQVSLDPTEWGWQLVDEKLTPTKTDMPPAPQELLEVIRCNCKSDCSTMRCNCKKHGLKCSLSCGECKGLNCQNIQDVIIESDDEYDDKIE